MISYENFNCINLMIQCKPSTELANKTVTYTKHQLKEIYAINEFLGVNI